MFSFLKRAGALAGVVAFARSPQGRQMIGKAKTYAQDPATRQKVMAMKDKYLNKR